MLQIVIRVFLVLALLAVGMTYVEERTILAENSVYLILGALALASIVIGIEVAIPRKSLQALSGLFFGLVVGLVISYGLNIIVQYLVSVFSPQLEGQPSVTAAKLAIDIISCYLCVSFVVQTKDDVRFVIPYVEFSKQVKGQRPLLLDTSVLIDGRIVGICEAGFLDHRLVVPRFVLHELQLVADSADKLKRARGRRGLDVLNALKKTDRVEIEITDAAVPKPDADEGVDLKLLALANVVNGRVMTNDYNLNKVAQVRGIEIININDLANALKPIAIPGEALSVKIIKPGESPGQGVGYLDDGTMVVVEQGRGSIGENVNISVTSVLQTSAGRMIFGRIDGAPMPTSPPPDRRPRPASQGA